MKPVHVFGGLVGAIVLFLFLTKPELPLSPAGGFSERAPGDPAQHRMARHITSSHAVRIGSATGDDIQVTAYEDQIEVRFQECLVGRLRENALITLGMQEPVELMDRVRYNEFLTMLHGFLTVSPAAPKPSGDVLLSSLES